MAIFEPSLEKDFSYLSVLLFTLLPFFFFSVSNRKISDTFSWITKKVSAISFFIVFGFLSIYAPVLYILFLKVDSFSAFSLMFIVSYLLYLILFVLIFLFLFKYKFLKRLRKSKTFLTATILSIVLFVLMLIIPAGKITCYYNSDDAGMGIYVPQYCHSIVPELVSLNRYISYEGRNKGLGKANLYYLDGQVITLLLASPYLLLILGLYLTDEDRKKKKVVKE